MILVGNQRGGASDLARHLTKPENERVELHQLRGFVADDLHGAFRESYAISRGTKCKQFLFSLSLNPPMDQDVPKEVFEKAIAKIEARLGLEGQPRAIVYHVKEARRHCHVVWSRINANAKTNTLTAVQMSFYKTKLTEISRSLYLEHGWQMPAGLANPRNKDPRTFTLAEWQRAKRTGRDPRDIKADIAEAWAIADSKPAFTHALAERGLKLARGDRGRYVAVDHEGEVWAIARATGVKIKSLRAVLGPAQDFPTVSQTRQHFAQEIIPRLEQFRSEIRERKARDLSLIKDRRDVMLSAYKKRREQLRQHHLARTTKEQSYRQKRFRRGILGLWDRMTGRRAKHMEANRKHALLAERRDQTEREALLFDYLAKRRDLHRQKAQSLDRYRTQEADLNRDIARLNTPNAERDIREAREREQAQQLVRQKQQRKYIGLSL